MTFSRPTVLDLFCGGGGASVGYWLAGFDVVGLDIVAQPHYPFRQLVGDATRPAVVGDAITELGGSVTLVHASPVCKHWSAVTPAGFRHRHDESQLRRVVDAVTSLVGAGLASHFVVENVPRAPVPDPIVLCGGAFGLGVRRHRLFACSFPVLVPPCVHDRPIVTVVGSWGGVGYGRPRVSAATAREAMGVPWMPWPELAQSIPPAYTEFLGRQLAQILGLGDESSRRISSLAPRCECGQRLSSPATGRWPLHCSHACRQAAYRRRRASVTAAQLACVTGMPDNPG